MSDRRPYEKFADGSETCIEDEIPFDLPPGWAWARLGVVLVNRDAERIPLSVSEREKQRGRKYDYYGASGVIDKVNGYLFDKPLLLVGEDGANLLTRSTPIAFIARSGKYWVNNHAHVLDCPYSLTLKYVEIFINAISLAPYVTGTAQPKMNQEKMNSILISLPPLAEQHRIVAEVEELLPKITEYENIEKQLSEFEAKFPCDLKRSILQAAVEGKLVPQDTKDKPVEKLLDRITSERKALIKAGKLKRDKHESVIFRGSDRLTYETRDGETVCIEDELPFKIPESWAWVRLNSLGTFVGGHTPSLADHTNWDNGNVIWITSKDMKSKYIVDSGEKLSAKGAKELQLLPPETILMVTRSGILKHTFPVAIAKTHLTINQDQRALRLHCPDMSEFVYVLLRGLEGRILRDFVKKGTTVQSILWDKFINMPIPLPPLAEQQRIVAKVERMEAQVAQLQ